MNSWDRVRSRHASQKLLHHEQLTDVAFSLDQVPEAREESEKRIVTRAVICAERVSM
jgi:hypothetical protein